TVCRIPFRCSRGASQPTCASSSYISWRRQKVSNASTRAHSTGWERQSRIRVCNRRRHHWRRNNMEHEFESHRRYLFAVAYRMLSSVSDAEDIVQDAYLRYLATPRQSIQSPRAFLTTIVTRLCLNHLQSARVRRETYVGPW